MVLRAIAGTTPAANSAVKDAGKLTRKNAAVRKIVPDTRVPMAVKTPTLTIEFRYFFKDKNKPRKTKAVIGLSMIFGICPPGNPVVNADNTPVTIAKSKTLLISGIRIIPKNIIASIMSGFIPRKLGITVCKTTPIPANSAKITMFFVFISHLSSAQLSNLVPPAVPYMPAAKNLHQL